MFTREHSQRWTSQSRNCIVLYGVGSLVLPTTQSARRNEILSTTLHHIICCSAAVPQSLYKNSHLCSGSRHFEVRDSDHVGAPGPGAGAPGPGRGAPGSGLELQKMIWGDPDWVRPPTSQAPDSQDQVRARELSDFPGAFGLLRKRSSFSSI